MGLQMQGPAMAPIFARMAQDRVARMRRAFADAAEDTARDIEAAGRSDLQSAGNFGGWSGGFIAHVVTVGTDAVSIKATIETSGSSRYWFVHQQGMTISGKPWLAIPLPGAGVPKGMYARYWPGGLYVAKGVLFSKADHTAKYVLKQSVTIPKRLHLVEASEEAAKKFGDHLKARMTNG